MKHRFAILVLIVLVGAGIAWLSFWTGPFLFLPAQHVRGQDITETAPLRTTVPDQALSPSPSPTAPMIVGPYVGRQAPGFALKTLADEPAALDDYRGKVVLLNFWASWCIPCKEEMPVIQAAYEKYRERDFVVLGINMTNLDNREDINLFLQETKVTFLIFLDETGSVSDTYLVNSIPTTFLIDRNGVIRHFQVGPMSAQQLQDYLDEMLK